MDFLRINPVIKRIRLLFANAVKTVKRFLKSNWIGMVATLCATVLLFGPLIMKVDSYSEGGDVMFNAWTLSRDHHCILRENCPNYVDGNIYYPNKDTMLYSETQLSAGLLTLPLHLVDDNPILANNVWTILSFVFSAFFMYLLAKNLSGGRELVSVLAGLAFSLAPFKMTGMGHLQNQSIFYLPLIILFFRRILEPGVIKKRYVAGSLIALLLLFFASWYQMVFALMAIVPFLAGMLVINRYNWRKVALCFIITIIAAFATLPLAKEYVRFSKSNKATFAINDQIIYSSSLKDYFIPYKDTLAGDLYYKVRPNAKVNGYNPDSSSYHGVSMYLLAFVMFALTIIPGTRRKFFKGDDAKLIQPFLFIGIIGFIVSLGPLLKISDKAVYSLAGNTISYGIALPYLLVDKFLPQLSFIRAIGRASVLVLFSLCCMIAFAGPLLDQLSKKSKYIITALFIGLLVFEIMPTRQANIIPASYAHHNGIPEVYKYIKDNKEIDSFITLRSDNDYPGAPIPVARAEDVLWAGYHNKNLFNGYSGYEPPQYGKQYGDFVDFHEDDVVKLQKLGLNYVLVDKQLSGGSSLLGNVRMSSKAVIFEDQRYSLFRI